MSENNTGRPVRRHASGGDSWGDVSRPVTWDPPVEREAVVTGAMIKAGITASKGMCPSGYQLQSDQLCMIYLAMHAARQPDEASCDLCAGECRGHSFGRPEEWEAEPGSRAAEVRQPDEQMVERVFKDAFVQGFNHRDRTDDPLEAVKGAERAWQHRTSLNTTMLGND